MFGIPDWRSFSRAMILSTDILGYGITIENLGCGGLKFAGKGTEVEKKY